MGVVSMFSIAALVWVAPANAQKIGRVSLKRSQSPAINEPETNQNSPIMVEEFGTPVGSLLSASGWGAHSGAGTNAQTVTAGNLTYTGWPSSGGNNSVTLTTSGEDDNHGFPPQTTGTVYAAALVNVSASQTTGDYFFHVFDGVITGNKFLGRVFVKKDPSTTNYAFGIQKGSTVNTVYTGFTFTPGSTHLIVIKYTFVAGTTNDTVDLIIDPVLGGSEPAPTVTAVVDTTVDAADIRGVALRQGSATAAANVQVDDIRVSRSWTGLLGTYSPITAAVDFNGDGKTDYSVYRVSAGAGGHQLRWYTTYNGVAGDTETAWGLDTDAVTPGDFDGDGKDDVAVWRGASGGNSAFYIIQSATVTVRFVQFGLEGDDPYMIADYDGDGKDDVAIYRPGATAGAQSTFWWMPSDSGSPLANHPVPISWGAGPEDGSADFPVPGDFNGDGKADFCIYRNNGSGGAQFWLHPGSGGVDANAPTTITYFGQFSDTVVPGDYDGDGKTDIAVVRNEGGNLVWYIRPSSGVVPAGNPYPDFIRQPWGLQSSQFNPDYPVQGDYDGDGKTDIAVWRDIGDNSAGDHFFYVLGSQSGVIYKRYGQGGDIPTALDTH